MAELGQQTVDFSSLVSRTAEESFTSLKELVEKSKSSDQSDTEKKINLLKYIVKTQQRMLRLNVLAKWCQQVSRPALVPLEFTSLTSFQVLPFFLEKICWCFVDREKLCFFSSLIERFELF